MPSDLKSTEIPADYPSGFGIEWTSTRSFRLGGYDFDIPGRFEDYLGSKESISKERLYLGKTPGFIRRYVNLFNERQPGVILDLGVHLGGSAAFSNS
jgi:hypothetical protein